MSSSSKASARPAGTKAADDELVDVCIVGAGIAGVVAAMRAQELGLSLQLVEARKLLHTCQPDSSDAQASASPAPVSALDFARSPEPLALTRETIEGWKQDLHQRGIPLLEDTHVFAIEREKDGSFCSRLSEASLGRERRLRSRAVLIATGSPNAEATHGTRSTASRSQTAMNAANRPALVVGDSAQAIETLVEISSAKLRDRANPPVYWCPGLDLAQNANSAAAQVDDASELSKGLFAAIVRNQNVQTLPRGVGLAPLETSGGRDRVTLEFADSANMGHSASERQLAFDQDCVFRFDGGSESSPRIRSSENSSERSGWELLSSLSVRVDRRDDQSLLVVDVAGRLSHVGLYAAGAVRGEDYLLCAAFGEAPDVRADAPSMRFEKVRRSDGLGFAANEAIASIEAIARSVGRGRSLPAEAPVQVALSAHPWTLVRLNLDGSAGARFELTRDVTEIGRTGRDIDEPDDAHMADHHASIVNESGEMFVADTGRGSGVWLRIDSSEGVELGHEDQVWLGAQILVATKGKKTWMVVHYGPDGLARETYAVGDQGIFVGRESGHVLDVNDGLLSRRHAQFCVEGNKLKVYDRGARNGTYVKVSGATPIDDGAEFRVSARGYRLERSGRVAERAGVGGSENRAATVPSLGGNVVLEDRDHPRSFPVGPGSTLLQGFSQARGREGEPIAWECQAGTCGLCVIEVVSGADNLVPLHAQAEEERIIAQTRGELGSAKNLRMACLAKTNGDIVIRSVK